MTAPNPTWYDILGVERDADPARIKAAWRDATDKFEPGAGSGQFRLFNEAADVLLDPEKRAEYDAILDHELEPEPEKPKRVESESTPPPPPPPPPPPFEVDRPGSVSPAAGGSDRRRLTLAAALAVLLILALGVASFSGIKLDHKSDAVRARVAAVDAGDSAMGTAERALGAVLSYDYRRLDADRARAVKFLTKSYRADYEKTFELLANTPDGKPGNAVKTKTVVVANVRNIGVVDADTERVRLLAFVDQSATKGTGSPSIFMNRVVVTMLKQGGNWLIESLQPY